MAALIFDFDDPLPRRLYWDASFLVHATYPGGRYHQDCYTFLERLDAAVDTLSYVSSDDFASVDNLRLHTCNSKILSRTRE
jgi:hypothetical protein